MHLGSAVSQVCPSVLPFLISPRARVRLPASAPLRERLCRRRGGLSPPIQVGFYRLPGRNPKRVQGRRPGTLSKSKLGNVPASGQRDQPNQIVLEDEGLPAVPGRRLADETRAWPHQPLSKGRGFKPSWLRLPILETPYRRRAPAIRRLP